MTTSSPSTRRLLVMRHAKAESFAADDHGRTLTDRGRRDATEAGVWLAAGGFVPDLAYVSPSARTVGTWEAVGTGSRASAEVRIEDDLYTASPETALEILRGAPEDAQTVLLVGHNPTVAHVAHMLDSGDPDPVAYRQLSEGYPPAAVTVLGVPVDWADLSVGSCRIHAFHLGHG